jgi:haloacetate dehalogenase
MAPPAFDSNPDFFPGFRGFHIETAGAIIRGVTGGSGPPVLLLHGWPQSLIEWRVVAPELARNFTVVATDLRGYGDSSKPPGGEHHQNYSKRCMAADQVEVMRQLGFPRFALVGHDRGGRVGHRLALDHPEALSKLAMIDIVPTLAVYANVTKELATAYYHWFLLIQPEPVPETLLGNSARFFLEHFPFRGLVPGVIDHAAFADYLRCFCNPETLHAMCEDYRAAASIDLEHDRADVERGIACPTLVLWGQHAAMGRLYDVLATWQARGANVRGHALPGGHWLCEECPGKVVAALKDFLI